MNAPTDGHVTADNAPRDFPETSLLTSSMRQQPVPGWTINIDELGLPVGSGVVPMAFVDDRAVLLGVTAEDWRIFGLNVADGKQFMRPLEIGSAEDADIRCSVNRPPYVLCVWSPSDPAVPSRAVLVDTASGDVTFDGPTELRASSTSGLPSLQQVGDHGVATVTGKGVYGVGLSGELTWFVPGDGILPTQFTNPPRDTTPPTLAVQGSGGTSDVVFSVIDGSVVNPALPQDVQLGRAVVYPGGFGYEFTLKSDLTKDRVALFDNTGGKLSELASDGTLEVGSPDLPMVKTARQEIVMTLGGDVLQELPRTLSASTSRLIGSRLFVQSGADEEWAQYDLSTGEQGKSCAGDALGTYYLASDGEVVVAAGESSAAQGVDLSSCETLWTLPQRQDEVVRVWKVNTTIIQRSDDRLFSLVAPG